MSKNISTVQSIYAAFGRGDVPAILEHVSDECDWEYGGSTADVPWLQRRKGRAGAAEFLRAVGTELEMKVFSVSNVIATDRLVVAVVSLECTVRRTGTSIRETDEVHLWHFDDAGRIAKFRHCVDSYQHAQAWAK